jgi:DNA ligase-1
MAADAQKVLLANKWDDSKDPTGYWMSEKLDGVRGYWTGSSFYSRQGNSFPAPKWFTKDLPKEPLDGELWCGRALFQKTLSIVKGQKTSTVDDWKYVTYLVFDAPKHGGKYEDRVAWLNKTIKKDKETTYAAVVGIQKCEGAKHLKTTLQAVLKKGGEGIMLRQPGSLYENCRSDTLLKVKYFHDEEARVTAVLKGSGRCQDMMGKLACELPNGVTFKVGTGFTDAMRKKPPKVGSIITFKFQECSDTGTPRFPVFLNARPDLTWADVIANAKTKPPWSQMKQIKPDYKRQHSIIFSTIPSRDNLGAKIVTTDDEDSDEEASKMTTKKKKEPCKYGKTCFRKSHSHLAHFTHPEQEETKTTETKKEDKPKKGAAVKDEEEDAKPEAKPDKAKKPAKKIPCKFGSKCYRKSAFHLEKFSHDPKDDTKESDTISKEDLAQMKRGVSMNKVNMNDYFDLGLSEDELGDWGLSDDEKPAKRLKGEKGVKVEPVKVEPVPEPRAAPPSAKKLKSEKTQKAPKAAPDSVMVSKKEWESMKQQLEMLKNSLLSSTVAAAPSLPPRPELKRTRSGSSNLCLI